MNIKLILLFLITISQTSWSQNCDFEIRKLSTQLSGESTLIEKSVYDNLNDVAEPFIELTQITEHKLVKKYPEIFNFKDSCYKFPVIKNIEIGISENELKACKNLIQSREYSNYQFKGVYSDNALIEINGYESWGFLSVDLLSGLTCYTMGKPYTSNGKTIISYSNYYGEEEIALTDLKTKKQYVIGIEGWHTIESKVFENEYYLKLEPFMSKCENEIKYLKVSL